MMTLHLTMTLLLMRMKVNIMCSLPSLFILFCHLLELSTLSTSEKHRQIRKEADARYRLNAERMQMKYCKSKHKKVQTFSVGDFVGVQIPRIDRSSTDSNRVMCVVVEKLGNKHHLYRLKLVYLYFIYIIAIIIMIYLH